MATADVEIPIGKWFVIGASVLCKDANLSEEFLRNVVSGKDEQNEYVFFEPTSVTKSVKLRIVNVVDATSPNAKELREMANALRRSLAPGSPPPCPFNPIEVRFSAGGFKRVSWRFANFALARREGCLFDAGELGSIVSSSWRER